MKKNKKAIVSLATFIFITLIATLILTFSNQFYEHQKLEKTKQKLETESLNSLYTFRSQILEIPQIENTTITYQSKLDSEHTTILIQNNKLSVIIDNPKLEINKTDASLTNFCNNYIFYPAQKTKFKYSNGCISKLN